jgi:hypothetical protein
MNVEPRQRPLVARPGAAPRTVQDVGRALALPSLLAVGAALLVGVIVFFIAADYERTRTPVYQSQAVLLLDSPAAIATDPTAVNTIFELRAKYVGLINSDLIAKPAAATLGLPESVVAGSAFGIVTQTSLDIVVRAVSSSAPTAQRIADAVAQQLVSYVQTEQSALPAPIPKLKMQVIAAASEGDRISPNHRKEITTGAVYGIVAAAATYVIIQVGEDTRRRRRALQNS